MAELNLKYYGGDNLYSDGDVENEILEIAESGKSLDEMERVSFPVLYHLSKARENILNWYPFRRDGHILEIGSGCGAITGLLCRKAEKVVSVELSKRRADINYARHSEMANLEIMVGNLNDMEFHEKFDYVVLNGVFEYAMSFTQGEQPYETFLNFAAGFLKPSGRILIAIENRLGLKYFAGAPEDHTDAYFDGLNQYEGNHSVRTFSKGEWVSLMERCGMKDYQFYYPYPDYKFPGEIFTNETLEDEKYGKRTWNFTDYRITLFNEEKMADTLIREGIMDRFANSFLIEMSREKMEKSEEILYVKLNRDRDCRFAIATSIKRKNGKKYVEKSPLDEQAKAHLENMYRCSEAKDMGRIRNLSGEWRDSSVVYPFLNGKSLGKTAGELIVSGQIDRLRELVRLVYDSCLAEGEKTDSYHTGEFAIVFGEKKLDGAQNCVDPANIDLILDNIFPDGDKMELIDGEWLLPFAVPSAFIIWRTINQIYTNYPRLEETLARAEFLGEYGITEEMAQVFYCWDTHFAQEYVGANKILACTKPEMWFHLADVRTGWKKKEFLHGSIFVDTGEGFSEEQKIAAISRLENGRFSLHVSLEGFHGIKNLRWDPVEEIPCACRIDEECRKKLGIRPANGIRKDDGDIFLTTDPIYEIQMDGEVPDQLVITGEYRELTMEEVLRLSAQEQQKNEVKNRRGIRFWRK